MVDPKELHEQTINAQVMDPKEFDQLVDNISQRGQLESLPYCWRQPGTKKIEIVSGHHRVRAANAAGLKQIPVLLDTSDLSRSRVTAIQIAHNQLHGTSDEATLRVMTEMITDLDDLIMTGLPDDFLPVAESQNINLLAPKADFDWRIATFTFLGHNMTEFEEIIDAIDRQSSLIGIAPVDQFKDFSDALVKYGATKNIKNLSTALQEITRIAVREIENDEKEQAGTEPDNETSTPDNE